MPSRTRNWVRQSARTSRATAGWHLPRLISKLPGLLGLGAPREAPGPPKSGGCSDLRPRQKTVWSLTAKLLTQFPLVSIGLTPPHSERFLGILRQGLT